MATVNAAEFLGLNAGRIEKGKKADVVCIDAKQPNLLPPHNVVSHLVYAASALNVSDVIINGKMIYHERKFLNVDEEKVYNEVEKAAEELVNLGE